MSQPMPSGLLRASDADRDAIVASLRSAYAEGRLTDPELHDRLERALAARTVTDLAPLTADLPPARERQTAPERAARIDPVRAAWLTWAAAVFLNVLIWALVSLGTRQLVHFWPMWVAGPWGAVLLRCGFAKPTVRASAVDRQRDRLAVLRAGGGIARTTWPGS